jgi:hypothetical protein
MAPNTDPARRVLARFLEAKPYSKDKETKEHKAEKLGEKIRDATGLSKGVSEAIADAIVRGREVIRLALQKNWPISEDGVIEGPKGTLGLKELGMAKTASSSRTNAKKEVTDYFEKPESFEDAAERLASATDIMRDLDKIAKKLAARAQELGRFSEKLKTTRVDTPSVWIPQEVEGVLQDDVKKAETSLIAIGEAYEAAAKAYQELSWAFDQAEEGVRDREDELLEIYHEASKALK